MVIKKKKTTKKGNISKDLKFARVCSKNQCYLHWEVFPRNSMYCYIELIMESAMCLTINLMFLQE